MMIDISFPDGKVRQYESGVSGVDIAKSISNSLAPKVVAIKWNNQVWDATRPIQESGNVVLLTWDDLEGKNTFWHSTAHLMAEAIEALHPGTKFGIGPAIESGFYYDIDLGDKNLSSDELVDIEKKMKELSALKNIYSRQEISKSDAIQFFTEKKDNYKLELLERLKDGEITFYTQGNFTDLCRGPHIPDTGFIKAVKLTAVAGAYWLGDEKRKQLTRIYGISFPKQAELDAHLLMLEEAKKRDHRKLGKELELFAFSERVGLGLPLWLPRGARLRENLIAFMQKAQTAAGYLPVVTPHIANKNLFRAKRSSGAGPS